MPFCSFHYYSPSKVYLMYHKGVPSAVGFPHCAGSGEGLSLSPKPYPHKCAEAGARTRDLPVTDGRLYRCTRPALRLITTSVNKSVIYDIDILFHLVVVCFWPFGSKSLWTDPFILGSIRFLGYSFKPTFWWCQCRLAFLTDFVILCTLFVFYQ